MGLVVGVIAWLLADKRRLVAAVVTLAVVGGGLAWINTRPASRSAICAQAEQYRAHLEASRYEVFDNEFFTMAAALGKAASNPDPDAGGDLASLRAAGQQLARVGGTSSANQGQVESALGTVEIWCAVGAAVAAAEAGPDGDLSSDDTLDYSTTGPEATDASPAAIEATVDCASLVPDVQAAISPDLQLATSDWEGGPDMQGLVGFSYCGFGAAPQPGGSVDVGIEYARFQSAEQARAWLSEGVDQVGEQDAVSVTTFAGGGQAPVVTRWDSWGEVYLVWGSESESPQLLIDLLGRVRDATAHD